MKYVLLSALGILLITACKRDKEAPVITISSPPEHAEFHYGETIHVEAVFTDDRELLNYSFKIGDANGAPVTGLNYEDYGNITGEKFDFHAHIQVPDTLFTDVFYLHFNVKDASGKSTDKRHMLHTH